MQYATYAYLADGKLDYQDYGNGVHTAYGYDERGFLSQESVTWGGQSYADRTYTRDNRDRITSFRKGTSGNNPMEDGHGDRFRYDEEGELVEAWYNATDPRSSGTGNTRYDSFNYDALGNRRGMNYVQTHGWQQFSRKDNGLNQYRMWSPFSMINYDDDLSGRGAPGHANGVLMQDGNVTAGYNALNQPMYIFGSAGWVSFGYDPLGRCVKRWAGLAPEAASNPATYFYYDGWNLIQEGPSASTISQLYMLGNRVDEIVADYAVANGQWMYHSSDGRGHAMLLTAANGSLAEQYEYDGFGQPYFFSSTGQLLTSSAFGNRFLFTGREYLSDLKLYDYRNRMYQPELGRFMQPDPKQFAAGDYNLYRYCHNDPINQMDPTGLDPIGRFIGELVGGYVFGALGADAGAVAGAATGLIGGIETGPGELIIIPVGAIAGGVAGGVVGTSSGTKIGGYVGDQLGDKIKEKLNNIFESRGRDQGERRRQGSNPNPEKRQTRDHQTGKKLPTPAPPKEKQPEPEVIPKGKKGKLTDGE